MPPRASPLFTIFSHQPKNIFTQNIYTIYMTSTYKSNFVK